MCSKNYLSCYIFKKSNQGVCDCGDQEYYKQSGFCAEHTSDIQISSSVNREWIQDFKTNFIELASALLILGFVTVDQNPDVSFTNEMRKLFDVLIKSVIKLSENNINLLLILMDSLTDKQTLLQCVPLKYMQLVFDKVFVRVLLALKSV